jgi:MFS family permease
MGLMMVKFTFKEVAPCFFAIFIDILGFGLVAPLFVTIFTSPWANVFEIATAHARYLLLGLTLALYPLLMFFGSSFIGDLSDMIGRKKTLLISMGGMAVGFFIMGIGVVTFNLWLFLMGRGISGLVAASQSVALATISDISTNENKAIHLSYVSLIQCVGLVVGPLIGGVLSNLAFYAPFVCAGICACISVLWIFFAFEETFTKQVQKKVSLLRVVTIFIEAYQHQRIKDLSVAFLLMQIGIAFYFPFILIAFTTQFHYTPVQLGLFNGYLGVGFTIGLLVFLPWMLKRDKIEKIVYLSLLATFFAQLFSSIFPTEAFLWIAAFFYAISIELAFTGMFTAYSNAADETSQGWAMGVSVAVMAIAWAIAGACIQFVPQLGVYTLIFIGSLCLGLSAHLMRRYYVRYILTQNKTP